MTKINVWELVKKEAETVINAIENGEFHTMKEIDDYLGQVYSWSFTSNVMSIVNVYKSVNNIELPYVDE